MLMSSSFLDVSSTLENVIFVSQASNSDEDFLESITEPFYIHIIYIYFTLYCQWDAKALYVGEKIIKGDVSEPRGSSLPRVQVLP